MNSPDSTNNKTFPAGAEGAAQLAKIANKRLAENNTAAAFPYLSQIAGMLTQDVSSQMITGCAAASLGNFGEARKWFERARTIDPAHLEARQRI